MYAVSFKAQNLVDAISFLQSVVTTSKNRSRLTLASFEEVPGLASAAPVVQGSATFYRDDSDEDFIKFRNWLNTKAAANKVKLIS
jgi:hypothetical protein